MRAAEAVPSRRCAASLTLRITGTIVRPMLGSEISEADEGGTPATARSHRYVERTMPVATSTSRIGSETERGTVSV